MSFGWLRLFLICLFAWCLFAALFARHFASAAWFLILLGFALPSYKRRQRAREARRGA